MRSALLFTTILLFAIVPFSNTAAANGLDETSGITFTGSYDNSTEMTTLNITMPVTNNATLLDELKDARFNLYRGMILNTDADMDGEIDGDVDIAEIVASEIQFCTEDYSNSECSGASFEIGHYPSGEWYNSGNMVYFIEFVNDGIPYPDYMAGGLIPRPWNMRAWIGGADGHFISDPEAVENLTGAYSDGTTSLSWDYPESIAMNHSIMIYSHDSPATRENWNSLTKTIVSSSVAAGTTNFEINHSSSPVEREVYYSVTLLYETSEDTRFLGSNTLTVPVKEDNIAPLFVGELSATFNSELDMTTIDWGAGISDEDLMINIYRSQMHLPILDTNNLVATVDSSLSSFEVEVPMGEHRQSWYAITLVDSQGNENLNLSESSPVADPVIESTISSSQISNLEAERYSDGTITINWDDTTQSPNAIAKIWRSVSGPISSFDDLEELASTDVSLEQYSHNPLNPVDQAWYAITIEGTWGSGSMPWHDDSLTSGVNSMENSFRETEEEIVEPAFDVLAQVQSTSGAGGEISDGDMISLGSMYEGDLIIISTSRIVENISCNEIAGQGSVIYSQTDWALSFSANQSGEACYGTIIDGDDEIGFTMTWNYIENITIVDDEGDEDDTEQNDEPAANKGSKESKETIAGVILSIIILALLVYLLVMMKGPKYFEEE